MQRVLCPHCQNEIGYLEEMAGQNFSCPTCGQLFQMPHLSEYIQGPVTAPTARTAPRSRRARIRSKGPAKNSGLAAVLSFLFVGLGQIYNGDLEKGLLIYILAVVFGVTGFFLCLPFIPLFLLWLWAIYDAYESAEKYNRRLY